MQIEGRIPLRGLGPVWIPYTLRAYRRARFFLNLKWLLGQYRKRLENVPVAV